MKLNRWAIGGALLASGLLVSSCTPNQSNVVTSQNPSQSQTIAPSTSTATGSTRSPISGLPLNKSCDELMSAQSLYDFNPNFSFDASGKTLETNSSSEISNLGGIDCVYLNLTSQQTIQLGVAHISEDGLKTLGSEREKIPGVKFEKTPEGYLTFFYTESGVGVLDVTVGQYLISLASSGFEKASDASEFLTPIVKGLS
jgi:hypothetical protein